MRAQIVKIIMFNYLRASVQAMVKKVVDEVKNTE